MESSSILDHPALSRRLFYAWPNRFTDAYFVKGKGGRLGCWYASPFPQGLTMVHFHGNAETVGEYVHTFAPEVLSLGINLLLAEYRGYGMSEGEPRLAAMLEDIPHLVDACAVQESRLIFFGRSLGSLFAVHAASLYPRAGGLVLESAIADPLEPLLSRVEPRQLARTAEDVRIEVDRILNQKDKLSRFTGRTLVMHTRADDIIPHTHALRLYAWAREPKELVLFPRGNHNNIREVNRELYFAHLSRLAADIEADRSG
jgi:pimeloyl-ACP methyl ester carboxylesterase